MIRAGLVIIPALTDSYKFGHALQYPKESIEMSAYAECRSAFQKDSEDQRIVFYGMRYIIENYIAIQWTMDDIEKLDAFLATHSLGSQPFAFPRDIFVKFVKENNGYFPARIETLPEGSVIHPHVPVFQITTKTEYAPLVTFLETLLTHVWYPTSVATLSRRCKNLIQKAYEKSVDDNAQYLIHGSLTDFGFRGCTSVEQAIIGGTAHLLNFIASDTVAASYYAQTYLNNNKPVGFSVPATEHSVMTSWPNEVAAIQNMVDKFGGEGKVFSVVMDSYNYNEALTKVLPQVAEEHKVKGGTIVLRPDSGDPIKCVLDALQAGEEIFGCTVNSKGYKVLNHVSVIQGDGLSYDKIGQILDAVINAGYSVQNCIFGMGGGLLQKVNRDTLSFATKLCYTGLKDGTYRDVMKCPNTDGGKISLPGQMKVIRDRETGLLQVVPKFCNEEDEILHAKMAAGLECKTDGDKAVPEETPGDNIMRVVYDNGPVANAFPCSFDEVKARIEEQWSLTPLKNDPVSKQIKQKISKLTNGLF